MWSNALLSYKLALNGGVKGTKGVLDARLKVREIPFESPHLTHCAIN